MGSLYLEALEQFGKGDTFIETGSHYGYALETAKQYGFTNIHGIELKQDLFEYCKTRFIDEPKVKMWLGDSVDVLKEIMPTLTSPATLWLDAHASGPDLPGGVYGNSPLIKELESIALSSCKEHVLFIDDCRLLGTSEWDFVSKEEVLATIFKINPTYRVTYIDGETDGTFPNDIMIVSTFL